MVYRLLVVHGSQLGTKAYTHAPLALHGLLQVHIHHHILATLLADNSGLQGVVGDVVGVFGVLEGVPLVLKINGLDILQVGSLSPLFGGSITVALDVGADVDTLRHIDGLHVVDTADIDHVAVHLAVVGLPF